MITTTVNVRDAQTRLAELVRLVSEGNEIVIAEGDKPVARLVPLSSSDLKQRIAGLNRGDIWVSDDFDAPLPDEFWLGTK